MKLKLKSSARVNRRHLLMAGGSKAEIEKVVLEYLGVLGWAKASPIFVEASDRGVVLSVARGELDNVRAAFELGSSKIRILKVSGTLKGLGVKEKV